MLIWPEPCSAQNNMAVVYADEVAKAQARLRPSVGGVVALLRDVRDRPTFRLINAYQESRKKYPNIRPGDDFRGCGG
jgi:hypothetical protein